MIIFIYLLFTLWSILAPSQVLDDFQSKGYHEILNRDCGQEHFSKVYSDFDAFDNFIETHPEWGKQLYKADREFTDSYANSRYGTPPIGYVNQVKSGKRKKTYFHFTKDYLAFLKENYPDLLLKSEELSSLLSSLKRISTVSEKAFKQSIKSIPDLSKALQTKEGDILVLTKIVRYDSSELMASSLHYDFSGLSFLFDNSDDYNLETLMIAPYKEGLTTQDLAPPIRCYKKTKSKSSLLLIPGLALKSLHLPINPTPHAVNKQSKPRYAIIVFAMVPDIKLTYEEIRL